MSNTSLKNTAYNYLYKNIVDYQLKPGSPIIEQEISDIIGISRTPVREALKQLQAEGLIKHIPKVGNFVNEITIQDIEEIFSLRETLEVLALKKSIINAPDEEIFKLEEKLKLLSDVGSYEAFYEIDRNIHDLIVKYSYNKRLDDILSNLNSQIERLRRISAITPKRLILSKKEHIEIIEAIKNRNFKVASKLLINHIINVRLSVLNTYEINRIR